MYTRVMTKALLYCRVSTDDQVENGVSLEAQEQALALEAMRRGYEFEVVREEGKSGKSLEGRDKLAEALDLLDKPRADVLMAVRLDRLSRNVGGVASLMARSKKRGWGIILSGDKLDTTADGKFRTYLDAALAERERDIISVRTKEGMAEKKRQGVVFGRVVDPEFLPTYRRVLAMHSEGTSMNAIAKTLNDEGVPTAKGRKFYASTIKAMVTSATAKAL